MNKKYAFFTPKASHPPTHVTQEDDALTHSNRADVLMQMSQVRSNNFLGGVLWFLAGADAGVVPCYLIVWKRS